MYMFDLEIATAVWQLKLLTHPIVMVGWEGISFKTLHRKYWITGLTFHRDWVQLVVRQKLNGLILTVTKKNQFLLPTTQYCTTPSGWDLAPKNWCIRSYRHSLEVNLYIVRSSSTLSAIILT